MGFDTQPTGYEKIIQSDLPGAWQCLRGEVAENPGFNGGRILLRQVGIIAACRADLRRRP